MNVDNNFLDLLSHISSNVNLDTYKGTSDRRLVRLDKDLYKLKVKKRRNKNKAARKARRTNR